MSNNKENFISLLEKYENNVVVPIIQRGYAQGRNTNKVNKIREDFLDVIIDFLSNNSNKEELILDYIYGVKDNGVFYLLDGQQRLTTLFLFHWYIYNCLKADRTFLSKFSYETRITSTDFLSLLNSNKINIDFDKDTISNQITSNISFLNYYRKDPTVKGILLVLDEIHKKIQSYIKTVNNKEDILKRLDNIKFFQLDIKGDPDDLYIKMNSRGKQLTDFEIFKSKLESFLDGKIDGNLLRKFREKIDTTWSNFFWELSKKLNNTSLDDLFIKFFYRITLIYFIINNKDAEKLTDNEHYKYLKKGSFEEINENNKYSSFNAFKETYDENKNIINIIFKVLDVLVNEYNNNILNTIIPIWNKNKNDYDILSKTKYDHEHKNITIFSALIFYIEKNASYKKSFKQWMRIVWNITENSYINESSSINLIKLFNELSEHSANIYSFLANEDNIIETNISKEAKEAVQYERRKCKFIRKRCKFIRKYKPIIKNKNWEEAFIKAEEHPFFRGYIDFLIDDKMDIDKFNHRKELMNEVFGPNGTKGEFLENHLFLRALISKINYIWDLPDNYFKDTTEALKILIRYKGYRDYNRTTKYMLNNDSAYFMNNIIRDWFDNSKNKEELINNLNESIKHNSEINIDNNDDKLRERVKIAHEVLYKEPYLQNWMQSKGAHIIKNYYYGNLYVHRYKAHYDRILIGSYRNKLISYLMKTYKGQIENYSNIERCEIKGKENNFYCGWDIEIKIKNENEEYILTFNKFNQLTIKKDDEDLLDEKYRNLNDYTFGEYEKIIKTEFFDKYIK